jgi:hypothetical protein
LIRIWFTNILKVLLLEKPTTKELQKNHWKISCRGYRDGELRSWKTVHFDEARVYKVIDGQEEYVETVTKFRSLPMA